MPKYLFGKSVKELKWGIGYGQHVVHIIGTENGSEAEIGTKENNWQKVTPEEIFNNDADNKTKDIFLDLAKMADDAYNNPLCDDGMEKILFSLKDYLTASGRSSQQESYRLASYNMVDYYDSLNKKITALKNKKNPTEKEISELGKCRERLKLVNNFAGRLQRQTGGNLKIPEAEKSKLDGEKVSEISDTGIMGKIGTWVNSPDVLFPHEPSPNDIKQGIGVQDCFMLSALVKLAETNPKWIKDNMVDNGDGTVTVKFNKPTGPDTNSDTPFETTEPCYIKVNKTVNKVAGVVNSYSSSSLWVQMIEKAYAKFCNQELSKYDNLNLDLRNDKKLSQGMNAINRSSSYIFLNSFADISKKLYKSNTLGSESFGFGYSRNGDLYEMDENGKLVNHPKGYVPHEKNYFDFLTKQVNDNKEIITVGSNALKKRKDYALNHGIRVGHAYTVMKTFKRTVNGTEKYYVQLRDPYGQFRAKYDDKGELQSDNSWVGGFAKGGTSNMATFNLELTDYMKLFSEFSGISHKAYKDYSEQVVNKNPNYYSYEKEDWDSLKKETDGPDIGSNVNDGNDKVKEEKNLPDSDDFAFDNFDDAFKKNAEPEKNVQNVQNDIKPEETILNDIKPEMGEKISESPELNKSSNNPADEFENLSKDDFNIELDKDDVVENEKINQQNTVRLEERNELKELLSGDGAKDGMLQSLKDVYRDIKSTDEFYILTNTKKFRTMRDSLNDLIRNFNTIKSVDELADRILSVKDKAKEYYDAKCASVEKEFSKGGSPATRSMHRLTAALSLQNICTGAEPLSVWPSKKAESVGIIMGDINGIYKGIDSGEIKLNDNQLKQLGDTKKLLEQYVEKHPDIKKKLNESAPKKEEPAARHEENSAEKDNIVNDFVMV